jgi:tetratricopeptide (TPR) repeat protein
MSEKAFQHALVLMEQERYALAEDKLHECLATSPDNALAHALLADCLCERERLDEATAESRQAIRLDPELPHGYASLAHVLHERNHFEEAEKAIQEALRLEPENAHHYARLAAIHLGRRDWPATVDAAERGLTMDPENVGCKNLRAMALVKLGRNEEAGATIASALARAPENAFTHANQGWALLHEGKRQKALEHFREALRLDPTMDFAKAGIVEAMKSKNFIYAVMLRYFLWMARLSRTGQWAVILGGYFGYQILSRVADANPAWKPWIQPLLIAYMVFAVMTWIASPLFNLLLRMDRFGRYALSRDQIVASNFIGIQLALILVCGGYYLYSDELLALLAAGYFGLLLLPVSAGFNCDAGWPRKMMILYTASLALIGAAAIPSGILVGREVGSQLVQVFIWGSVLSGFVANFLMMQTARR